MGRGKRLRGRGDDDDEDSGTKTRKIIGGVVGAVALGAAGYGAYRYFRRNPQNIHSAQLQQLRAHVLGVVPPSGRPIRPAPPIALAPPQPVAAAAPNPDFHTRNKQEMQQHEEKKVADRKDVRRGGERRYGGLAAARDAARVADIQFKRGVGPQSRADQYDYERDQALHDMGRLRGTLKAAPRDRKTPLQKRNEWDEFLRVQQAMGQSY